MSDVDEVRRLIAEWVDADTDNRRQVDERMNLLVMKLADLWSMTEAEVLHVGWERGWWSVYPRVSKVARWFDGHYPQEEGADDGR